MDATSARRANRITVRDELGEVVAVIEIVSPGNKDSRNAIRSFTTKLAELIEHRVNLVVVDLFPPTPRDPQGMHKTRWDQVAEDVPFEPPPDEPLTVASCCADPLTGYVEPVAVGDPLPDIPLFLAGSDSVSCPLEASYQASWAVRPGPIRRLFVPSTGG